MPLALLRYGLTKKHKPWHIIPPTPELRPSYDVVIVGGGGHCLAAAYYLASRHGITNVAVLEKAYLGGGGRGRNTAIVRSNYLTPEGVRFYEASVKLWRDLSNDLGINVMYTVRGHLTLAHSDAAVRTSRWRVEVNKHLGVDSELIFPDEIARLCPPSADVHTLPGRPEYNRGTPDRSGDRIRPGSPWPRPRWLMTYLLADFGSSSRELANKPVDR